jgi:hypothetical protein
VARLTNQEKARRARERIVEEIRRRGAVNVSVSREGLTYTIHATSPETDRAYTMRTKTKASGDWQTSTTLGEPRREDPAETSFWILEDRAPEPHHYHVVPDWVDEQLHPPRVHQASRSPWRSQARDAELDALCNPSARRDAVA